MPSTFYNNLQKREAHALVLKKRNINRLQSLKDWCDPTLGLYDGCERIRKDANNLLLNSNLSHA